jgi:hypothetical protein
MIWAAILYSFILALVVLGSLLSIYCLKISIKDTSLVGWFSSYFGLTGIFFFLTSITKVVLVWVL